MEQLPLEKMVQKQLPRQRFTLLHRLIFGPVCVRQVRSTWNHLGRFYYYTTYSFALQTLNTLRVWQELILVWYREQVELNPGRRTNTESLLPVIQISPATVDTEEKLF